PTEGAPLSAIVSRRVVLPHLRHSLGRSGRRSQPATGRRDQDGDQVAYRLGGCCRARRGRETRPTPPDLAGQLRTRCGRGHPYGGSMRTTAVTCSASVHAPVVTVGDPSAPTLRRRNRPSPVGFCL